MKLFLTLISSFLVIDFALAELPESSKIYMAFREGETLKYAKDFLSLGDNWNEDTLDLKCYVRTSFPTVGDLFNDPISFSASVKLKKGDTINPDQLWGKGKYPANMSLQFNSNENPELKTNPLALNLFPIKDRFSTSLLGYRFGSSTLHDLYRIDPRMVLSVLREDGGVKEFEGTPLETRTEWVGNNEEIHSSGAKVAVSVYENEPLFFIETVGIYTDHGSELFSADEVVGYYRSYYCRTITL